MSNIVPVVVHVNLGTQVKVTISRINIGIIIAALEVNIKVIHLLVGIIVELGTVGVPCCLAIGCTEQIEVLNKQCSDHYITLRHHKGILVVS